MTVRIMYLIALERVFDNAIFDNQVKRLLLKIKGDHGRDLELTLLVLLPWIELTRRGIYSNFWRYKNELKALKQELSDKSIRLILVRTPFPSAFFQMKLLGLVWFSLIAMPIVWYWIFIKEVQVIHCRYYYATLAALLARRLFKRQLKVIFDVRSLLPEQGVVDGDWSVRSLVFRSWKAIERWMFKSTDLSIAVSPGMASRIKEENPEVTIETIPNFADLKNFKPDPNKRDKTRKELGIENRRVLIFLGTVGGRYPGGRIAEAVQTFFKIFGSESFFLLLSPSDEKRLAPIAGALTGSGLKRGQHWICLKARAEEVPLYLNAADWALLVLADFFSAESASPWDDYVFPIKFAEYLALGLPILTHPSNHGMTGMIQNYGVGAVLDANTTSEKLRASLQEDEDQMRKRCLEVAKKEFSLERFAQRYYEIYKELVA